MICWLGVGILLDKFFEIFIFGFSMRCVLNCVCFFMGFLDFLYICDKVLDVFLVIWGYLKSFYVRELVYCRLVVEF